jgi:hypothetical protein
MSYPLSVALDIEHYHRRTFYEYHKMPSHKHHEKIRLPSSYDEDSRDSEGDAFLHQTTDVFRSHITAYVIIVFLWALSILLVVFFMQSTCNSKSSYENGFDTDLGKHAIPLILLHIIS